MSCYKVKMILQHDLHDPNFVKGYMNRGGSGKSEFADVHMENNNKNKLCFLYSQL